MSILRIMRKRSTMRRHTQHVNKLILFFLVCFSPISAFELSFERQRHGSNCAQMECARRAFDRSSNYRLNDIAEVTLSVETARGIKRDFLKIVKTRNQWQRRQTMEALDIARVTGVIASANPNFFSLKAKVTDLSFCQNLALRYSCSLRLRNGNTRVAKVIGGDKKEEENWQPSEMLNILQVLVALADGVEKISLLTDVKAESVASKANDVRETLDASTEDFAIQLQVDLGGTNMRLQQASRATNGLIARGRQNISATLTGSVEDIVSEIEALETNLIGQLESVTGHNEALTESVNSRAHGQLTQRYETTEQTIDGLDNAIQDIYEALNTALLSVHSSSSDLAETIKGEIRTELSDASQMADSKISSLSSAAVRDFKSLKKDFNTNVRTVQEGVKDSIEGTRTKMITDAGLVEKKIDEEIENVIKSIVEVSQDISQSITTTADHLTSFLEEVESISDDIESAQDELSKSTTSFQHQISQHKTSSERKINSASTAVIKTVEEIETNINRGREISKQNINSAIEKVDQNLAEKNEGLQSAIEVFQTNSAAEIQSVNSSVITKLNTFEGEVTENIETVNSNVIQQVYIVEKEQAIVSDSSFNKTREMLQGIANSIDDLNTTIHGNIYNVAVDTLNQLGVMDIRVQTDVSGIANQVDNSGKESRKMINEFIDDVKSNLESVNDEALLQFINLKTSLEELIQNLNSRREIESEEKGKDLDSSLHQLEAKTLANIGQFRQKTQEGLVRLQGSSGGILTQVERLGKEINDEQNMITSVQNQYVELAMQLEDITNQIDRHQADLTAHQDSSNLMLDQLIQTVTTSGGLTLQLLTDLVMNVQNISGTMTTEMEDFHDNLSRLGTQLTSIGRSVREFGHANVDEISDMLTSNTELIMQYLQPKKCTRHMNYVSISNNQYVVIAANNQSGLPLDILCDTVSDGGGWIIIQRRMAGDVAFFRKWDEYKYGFGSLDTDFYMGNEYIHQLTSKNAYELRITVDYEEQEYIADYNSFYIDSEDDLYRLHVGNYSGTAGDALSYHDGKPFSTSDRDNDGNARRNCAAVANSGWWFRDCRLADLNGQWQRQMFWLRPPILDTVAHSVMKIRLKD